MLSGCTVSPRNMADPLREVTCRAGTVPSSLINMVSGNLSIMRGLDQLAEDISRARPVSTSTLAEQMVYDYPPKALHELLIGTDEIKLLIQSMAKIDEIRTQAIKDGMRTLKQDGTVKVFNGHLDMRQVRRV